MKLLITFLMMFASVITWQTYTDNINHFSIKYPAEWKRQTGVNTIAFLSPKENDTDPFQENVNLMLQDLSQQPMTLDEYTELSKKQVTDNLGASAIVSLKAVTLAGQAAKEFVYNMDYQNRKLKIKQCWLIKNKLAYLITYTADPSKFNQYESTATEIINSFKFNN